jgi:23S rRNA pseudouridine2605 synthase
MGYPAGMESIKLSKLLSERGVASRREAEVLIEEGRVTVNGEPANVEQRVTTDDAVRVDGRVLPEAPPLVYYLLYKPKGYITGRDDPGGRKSVLDLVEHLKIKVEPVGRLDFNTEGALLLTNDGGLAHKLTHPSTSVPKRYAVKVYRTPDEKDLAAIRDGRVFLEDGPTLPAKVRITEQTDTENAWVEVTVTEGRNRLVRRMFEALGHPVAKIRRESFATISIRDMERGQIRPLTSEEVRRLRDMAEGTKPSSAGRLRRKAGFAQPKPKKKRHGKHPSRKHPKNSSHKP